MAVQEFVNQAVPMAPPGVVLAAKLWGYTLNEWVLIGSGVLIVLQIFFLLRDKVYRPWKDKRDRQRT